MVARVALAALAAVVAAAMAVQLHANRLLRSSFDQVGREVAGQTDPQAHADAIDKARRVADLRPGTGGLFVAVALETRGKRHVQAERLARRAVRREPENFVSWLTLGSVRRARGDERGAQAAFARTRELNPLYPTPR